VALIGVTQVGEKTEARLVDRNTNQWEVAEAGEPACRFRVKRIEPERLVPAGTGAHVPYH
jgi:hypothetical protein